MNVQRHRGEGRYDDLDTPENTPAPARSGHSDSWRRDKRDYSNWIMAFFGILFAALITMGISTINDMQARLVRVETKIDDFLRASGGPAGAKAPDAGAVAGTPNQPRNTP